MNKYLQYLLIGSVSLFGLYLAFSGEDINQIISEFKKVKFYGALAASLLLLFSCLIRAYRWRLLIEPLDKLTINQVFSATMIGYFGNGVLAFRLGEILKSYSVSLNTNLKTSQAIGTVVLERALDLAMVFLMGFLLLPYLPIQFYEIKISLYILSGIIFFFCFSLIVIKFKFRNSLGSSNYFLVNRNNKILTQLKDIYDGFRVIKNNKKLDKIFISTIILWVIYFMITLIVLNSCSIDLTIIDAGILFILGSLALGIPALPGSLGTYDAAVKHILVAVFSIKSHEALNYAIVSHAISYFPLTLVGAVYFITGNVGFKNLKRID